MYFHCNLAVSHRRSDTLPFGSASRRNSYGADHLPYLSGVPDTFAAGTHRRIAWLHYALAAMQHRCGYVSNNKARSARRKAKSKAKVKVKGARRGSSQISQWARVTTPPPAVASRSPNKPIHSNLHNQSPPP